jgi:hypothetical protein
MRSWHPAPKCEKYIKLQVPNRKICIIENRLCYNCLSNKHFANKCPKPPQCRVEGCNGRHHTTLHEDKDKRVLNLQKSSETDQEGDPWENTSVADDKELLEAMNIIKETDKVRINLTKDSTRVEQGDDLNEVEQDSNPERVELTKKLPRHSLRVITVELENKAIKRTIRTNALLDDGATSTLITDSVAGALELVGESKPIKITGFGGHVTKCDHVLLTEVTIKSLADPDVERTITGAKLPDLVGEHTNVNWAEIKEDWQHLKDLDIQETEDLEIGMIIGGTEADLISALEPDVIGEPGDPVARRCSLGWSVLGPLYNKYPPANDEQDDEKAQMQRIFRCVAKQAEKRSHELNLEDPLGVAKMQILRKEDLDRDLTSWSSNSGRSNYLQTPRKKP